jgi:plasmid maintenance system antidote protein VapI
MRPWSVPAEIKAEIVRLYQLGFDQRTLVLHFGLSRSYISRLVRGERGVATNSGNMR